MSRSDFLPDASLDSKKRVAAAQGLFGVVPEDIFTGLVNPRHTKRRANLTNKESELLKGLNQEDSGIFDGGTENSSDGDLL